MTSFKGFSRVFPAFSMAFNAFSCIFMPFRSCSWLFMAISSGQTESRDRYFAHSDCRGLEFRGLRHQHSALLGLECVDLVSKRCRKGTKTAVTGCT